MDPGTGECSENATSNKRPQFDVNRPRPRKKNPTNCSLALQRVPITMNNTTDLNNHFSNFGKIVNIKCSYKGDPKAAIITFSSQAEANAAYSSTEPVLNDRSITMSWDSSNSTGGKQGNVSRRSTNQRLRKNVALNSNRVLNLNQPKAESRTEEVDDPQAKALTKHKKTHGNTPSSAQQFRKRQRERLQSRLELQKKLISKMERTRDGPHKEFLLRMIKRFQKSTEPVRNVIVAEPTTSTNATSPPRTKTEAQKDRLDAEVDLITEQFKRMHLSSSGPSERMYRPISHHLFTNT